MNDQRSPATIQTDIEMIGLELVGTDLRGDLSHLPMLSPVAGVSRIEFVDGRFDLIVAIDSDQRIPAVGTRRAVEALAAKVAGDDDRQFIQAASVVPPDAPTTLRIAVSLAPLSLTLDGIRQGLYTTERLQEFEMAHVGVDPEVLPAEQGEAVALVRQILGVA